MPTHCYGATSGGKDASPVYRVNFALAFVLPHQNVTLVSPGPLEVTRSVARDACRFGLKGGCSALLLLGGA